MSQPNKATQPQHDYADQAQRTVANDTANNGGAVSKSLGHKTKKTFLSLLYANPLYSLTLKTMRAKTIILVPNDNWPGVAERGCSLLNKNYDFAGQSVHSALPPWMINGASDDFLTEFHSFAWLRDLRAVGGDAARRKARALLLDWIQTFPKWEADLWAPDLLARRINAWIMHYNFFGASADEEFREIFMTSLIAQAKHLLRLNYSGQSVATRMTALKAQLYIHICLTISDISEERLVTLIEQEVSAQIWQDGVHVSRHGSTHMTCLADLIDCRNLLKSAHVPAPRLLAQVIQKMAAALKFFRQADGVLTCLNGGREETRLMIDTVLSQSGYKGKATISAKQSGFVKATSGRVTLFMDVGPEGPDIINWRMPASIELSVGKQRVFVSCGQPKYESHDLHAPLNRSLAASGLTLDNADAAFKGYQNFDIEPRRLTVMDSEGSGSKGTLIEASHAGYYKQKKTIHHRRVLLAQDGHDIRGEDILVGPAGHYYAVRFHLHPTVRASLIQDGYEILLQPQKGNGFRFLAGGHILRLEESLYMADGLTPKKTLQIVIEGQTISDTTALQWALYQETKA